MTSAHRYPPPPPNSQNDFRLPSLKDLNFYRPSGAQPALPPSQQQEPANPQPDQAPHPTRHPVTWSRSAYQLATPAAHQYSPAGHEVPPKVEYSPKHENNGYPHPGIPLSVQANSVNTNSASMVPPRNEDASHSPNQPKRQRTAPSAASRDTRASHPSVYPHPQYTSYPQGSQPPSASQYHSVAPGLPPTPSHATHPAPSSHEQVQHHSHPMQVTAHPGYTYPAYVQPRQTLLHPPNSSQVSQHNHSNPYPSAPPPPAHAPQPQGPWVQSHSPTQFQQQPPPQPPPPTQHPQHNPHPVHAPSNHHHHQHQPQVTMPASSNQPVQAHHHHHHQQQPPPPGPPANPQPPQQIPPPVQYHPHQQQYQNQYPHPSQQQQQQQQQQAPAFVRPTAVNPSNLENRSTYPVAEPPRVSPVQNDAMSEITDHCNILYSFANQYVNLQQSNPNAQPPPAELEEMSQRALKVVRLLDDFRRICIPESTQLQASPVLASNSVAPMETDSPGPGESSRPPKRPWEDSQEDGVPVADAVVAFQDQFPANPSPEPRNQSTAEQDMELIRTKRATSTAIANGSSGQPKSKYRKRSMGQRASPPGKCHSCNIRETPEWRRGPDGARTLCNACGLHYAKLMRKQNKTAGNGDTPQIDLETLRASTRAADIAEKGRNTSSKQAESSSSSSSKANNKTQKNSSDTNAEAGTPGTTTPAPSQTHQGSFQLVNMMAPPQEQQVQNHGHGHPSSSSSTVPTPMPTDSRPTSQHASTPQIHAPSSTPSHHPHPHPLHPPHPPWPTTAATTGPAAAASGAVSASSTASVRGGASGGSVNGSSFGNPPSQSPVDFIRRQYSLPTRIGNQHQSSSR